ncbi:MAG: prephenate dehydrogenase/arogenate dehydrogenase family protein [Methylococcaceae bacterium]
MFENIYVIGVGLIGGSLARTIKKNGLSRRIIGIGRDEDRPNLIEALELDVIDQFYCDFIFQPKESDCVVIAAPVSAYHSIFLQLKPHWSMEAIYTDVGSTKRNITKAAEQVFGQVPTNFVPAHPIAGAETSGVVTSKTDLFLNKRLIMTPLPETSEQATYAVKELWQQLGAEVSVMDVDHHDAVFAATSHLPHVLAFALVNMLGCKDEKEEIFRYAAGGFKDFTRIASSDAAMWLDICLANQDQIIPLLREFSDQVERIANMIEDNEAESIFNTFNYARQARQRFLEQIK